MKLNFKIHEFCITGIKVPIAIADKILHFHILPMQTIRDVLDIPITASLNSGYRPFNWEIKNGRNGNSQHTYGERKDGYIDPTAKGAVDWTCEDFQKNKDKFLDLIIKHTSYTRIAIYDTFIHCDYKASNGKRYIFESDSRSNWKLKKTL